ncbi:putative membrane protein [Methylophaga frappieri]|uniref:Putative membrane protein n=1 Tax=Methylophaga frappieri (strain ATCC BAA-2434 / DSM 25690 / JAM7) TaxID=754477 RepID=I1YFU5_METFJ|nr:DUF2069 domain-containing protein [Methylophaga frappieri]AFJ01788.1 putative membrane protein [Methylophaga frappieri]
MMRFCRFTSLLSYFGLLLTIMAWILLAPHGDNYPTAAMLLLGVLPLLFPLTGLLYGRSYTHAWSGFLVLFYLAHAIGELYSGDAFWLWPGLEIFFSLSFLIAANLYVRFIAKSRNRSQSDQTRV